MAITTAPPMMTTVPTKWVRVNGSLTMSLANIALNTSVAAPSGASTAGETNTVQGGGDQFTAHAVFQHTESAKRSSAVARWRSARARTQGDGLAGELAEQVEEQAKLPYPLLPDGALLLGGLGLLLDERHALQIHAQRLHTARQERDADAQREQRGRARSGAPRSSTTPAQKNRYRKAVSRAPTSAAECRVRRTYGSVAPGASVSVRTSSARHLE